MGATTIVSGGSAANTIAGLASLGGKGAFVGKVAADEAGRAFAHDIRAAGVHFSTAPATDGPSTARCLVLVTPDGQRTMNTFLGACQNLTSADLNPADIAAAADSLPRRLSLGSAGRQEGLHRGVAHRPWGGTRSGAHPVGCVLRRSPPAGIPGSDARRLGRYSVRQRIRTSRPVPDRRISPRRSRRCGRKK